MSYWENEVGRFDELVRRNTAAQSSLDELTQQYDQAAFELQSLRVQLQVLRERRDRHTIRVPAGWLVTRRMVEPGEWITTGQHLGQAGDYSTLLVPFALSTREFDRLKDASAITLHLPGAGEDGMRVPARIERVSPLFDPETRKRNVDLAVTPGGFAARGGIRAELTLELPDESGAVMLPASAVTRRYEDIWLTRPDGERVRVVLLGEEEDMARVQSPDVSPGDVFLAEPGE
jgi:multidrug efflux pump subunit AcrA (membrane-fusion protein)